MSSFMFQGLVIKYSCFEICTIGFPERLKHPDEGWLVCTDHITCYFLKLPVGFDPGIFQKISMNCGNLMGLANLHRNMIEVLNCSFHPISPIHHRKKRNGIPCLFHRTKKYFVVFYPLLDNILCSEDFFSYSILSYENSPLRIRTLATKEGCVKNENRRITRMDVFTDFQSCNRFLFSFEDIGHSPVNRFLRYSDFLGNLCKCLFTNRVQGEYILITSYSLLLSSGSSKDMLTVGAFVSLSAILNPEFLYMFETAFRTTFSHRS